MRRQEDAGMRPLKDDVLIVRSKSWERHLTLKGIYPEDYDQVYELALQIYNKKVEEGPFGIDYLLRAADSLILNRSSNERFEPVIKPKRKNCSLCKGTSLKYSKDGKIEYETKEGKKVAKRCTECYESKNKEITR